MYYENTIEKKHKKIQKKSKFLLNHKCIFISLFASKEKAFGSERLPKSVITISNKKEKSEWRKNLRLNRYIMK